MQFNVQFKTNQEFRVEFKHYLSSGGTGGACEHESYKGDYEVIPAVTAQTLATKRKLMENDVTIKEIPFFDVSNAAGGSTVYIGREIE